MDTVYFYCAAIGGGILVLQTVLMLIGAGDTDFDTDLAPDMDAGDAGAASSVLFQLSFKTVVAFLTFFGLAGMLCLESEMTTGATLSIAVASGACAFFLVGYLMSLLISLQSSGNLDLKKAIGSSAKVYLRIPEHNTGFGKVTVAVSGRVVTQKAITKGEALATGARVTISGMSAPDTYEVSPGD